MTPGRMLEKEGWHTRQQSYINILQGTSATPVLGGMEHSDVVPLREDRARAFPEEYLCTKCLVCYPSFKFRFDWQMDLWQDTLRLPPACSGHVRSIIDMTEHTAEQIDKRLFYRRLAAIAAPIAFQSLMQALVAACAAFMLGRIAQEQGKGVRHAQDEV